MRTIVKCDAGTPQAIVAPVVHFAYHQDAHIQSCSPVCAAVRCVQLGLSLEPSPPALRAWTVGLSYRFMTFTSAISSPMKRCRPLLDSHGHLRTADSLWAASGQPPDSLRTASWQPLPDSHGRSAPMDFAVGKDNESFTDHTSWPPESEGQYLCAEIAKCVQR